MCEATPAVSITFSDNSSFHVYLDFSESASCILLIYIIIFYSNDSKHCANNRNSLSAVFMEKKRQTNDISRYCFTMKELERVDNFEQ